MTIVNLRGCNGSGKSTVAKALIGGQAQVINLARYETPRGQPRYVWGYWVPPLSLVVVGPYRTDCGGCDAIKTQDLVCESVRLAAQKAPNVLFEGVIVSTLFSRYHALSEELGGMTWAYLDTPVDICLDRIQQRNGGKAIKEELVRDKIKSTDRTRAKAQAAGERIALIPHAPDPAAVVRGLFE